VPSELVVPYELPIAAVPTWQYDVGSAYESVGAEALRAPYGLVSVEPYAMVDARAAGKSVALAKIVGSGTSLAVDWAAGSTLRTKLTTLAALLRTICGPNPYGGLIWIQGEEDAESAVYAAAYEVNLNAFIAAVRVSLSSAMLPVLVVRLRAASPIAHAATVRAAQDAVIAADANVYLIDSDAAGVQADGIHYSDVGYQSLGQAIGAVIATL
jgi:hypothetical protein